MIGIEKTLINKGFTAYLLPYLKEKYGIIFCFTTRNGGYSRGKFESLNVDYYTGDSKKNVSRNRKLILKKLNLNDVKRIYSVKQVHGNRILNIDKSLDWDVDSIYREADCLITGLKKTPVMVMGADCNLILVADKEKKVIAAVHAGWMGTLKEIAAKVIIYMVNKFKSNREDIMVAFGPSIRKCCYKVDRLIVEKFVKKFGDKGFYSNVDGYFFLDLVSINYMQLKDEGISESNIFDCGECTYCNHSFFSYRRNRITGRQAAVAIIL
jgi:polyphenol oxidase